MTAPTPLLPFDGSQIPEALKRVPRWAPWRASWNEKRKKWDKIPHRADNPDYGLSTVRPEKWFKYEAALGALDRVPGKFAGVGYCMTKPHGTIGIDLDHCIVDGAVEPWAAEVVERMASYTEISPTGTGLRVVGLGEVPQDWNNHEIGIEVYGGNEARFLTITGRHLAGTPTDLARIDDAVLVDLARQYAKERRKAEVIDLNMPDILDALLLPDLAGLNLPERSLAFLERGEFDADRSGTLHGAGVSLYAAGLSDEEVFSILATNDHAMEVALDHRRQDTDRAMLYLWREHCMKAKGKGQAAIVTADEFDVVPTKPGERARPSYVRHEKTGEILMTMDNMVKGISDPRECGMSIAYDGFRDEIVLSEDDGASWVPFKDADYVRLRIALERVGFKPPSRDITRDAVLLVAERNQFDSAQVWLGRQVWDGVPRVESFMARYMGAKDSAYARAVSRYLWTALAGRVMEPGVQADMAPVLVGEQGIRKSSGVAAIAPDAIFFAEISFGEKDDDLSRKMRGRLIAELSELRGLHTKDHESIKQWITRRYEDWTPKYREFNTVFPRRLVFVGTTNKDEFLADETGNRRWLPINVFRVDVDAIKADRSQLWAEAAVLFLSGGVDYQEAETLAIDVHGDHMMRDAWEPVVREWLAEKDVLTGECMGTREILRTHEVLLGALRFDAKSIKRVDEMRIGTVLRALGYARKKMRVEGKPEWVFSRCVPTVPT